MKNLKNVILVAAALSALAASAHAAGPIAYPGSAWGVLQSDASVVPNNPDNNNWVYSGKITQGADWAVVKGWTIDTYGAVNYSVDTKGLDWNNKVDPAVGLKFTHPITRGNLDGEVDVSVQGVYEHRFGTVATTPQRDGLGAQVQIGYWFGWH